MANREVKSFCRFCTACCGVTLTLDDNQRITKVVGDKDDLMTQGYACFKGLQAPAALYGEDRILEPLKRQPDGSFAPIDLETALDEAVFAAAVRCSMPVPVICSITGCKHWGRPRAFRPQR